MIMTDVEGSTELWEQDSAAADRGIALHDSILRRLLPSYYGFEVGSRTGDLPAINLAPRMLLWTRRCSACCCMPDSRDAFAWRCCCWACLTNLGAGLCPCTIT